MFRKTIIVILCIIMAFLSGCASAEFEEQKEHIYLFDKTYEICDSSWHPFGKTVSVDDYVLYENDIENIFINIPDELFSEGILYHLEDDEYPDITQIDKIEKIDLVFQDKTITIDDSYILEFSELFSIKDIESSRLKKADMSSEFIYINVYYSNYPAYQNELLLCKTEDGEFGLMFCETKRNTDMFGSGLTLTISSGRLIQYLEQVL